MKILATLLFLAVASPAGAAKVCPEFDVTEVPSLLILCDELKKTWPTWVLEDCAHHLIVIGGRAEAKRLIVETAEASKKQTIRTQLDAFDSALPLAVAPAPPEEE